MRLVSYAASQSPPGAWAAGVLVGDRVVDAEAIGARLWPDRERTAFASTRGLLALDASDRERLVQAAADAGDDAARTLDDVVLGPPVPDPDKILCLGLNYRQKAADLAMAVPDAPVLFAKFRNCLVGSGAPIVLPGVSTMVDYEGELAVVIGRRCKHVPEHDALACVAGYMPFNDVSARDLQLQTPQWTAGKAPDTFAPCGPALTLATAIEDVHSLDLTTRLNGTAVQHANTSQMIFTVAAAIAFISRTITLEPGDIIATGTPSGVGLSAKPPVFLKPGDVVEIEIEALGVLSNPVAAEEAR
jgi:2-keto-4-pentenoate hydratase/2-oxohepta-3-ene-1,7-dioic acid hydratase in catechol pathway